MNTNGYDKRNVISEINNNAIYKNKQMSNDQRWLLDILFFETCYHEVVDTVIY